MAVSQLLSSESVGLTVVEGGGGVGDCHGSSHVIEESNRRLTYQAGYYGYSPAALFETAVSVGK